MLPPQRPGDRIVSAVATVRAWAAASARTAFPVLALQVAGVDR